jgi:hypothetical protein
VADYEERQEVVVEALQGLPFIEPQVQHIYNHSLKTQKFINPLNSHSTYTLHIHLSIPSSPPHHIITGTTPPKRSPHIKKRGKKTTKQENKEQSRRRKRDE